MRAWRTQSTPSSACGLEGVLEGIVGTKLADRFLIERWLDEIVPPGIDVGPLDACYNRTILKAKLRRRPTAERAAA